MKQYSTHPVITETSWRALGYFNLYRLFITLLFVGLIWIGQLPEPLGLYDQKLFSIVAHLYLLSSILIAISLQMQPPAYLVQVVVHVFIDILAISLMMYASDGLSSGFGMLLVISVAGGSLLASRKLAVLFAAVAALVVLGHEVYIQLNRYFPSPNYTHAGLLGITFFITAILGNALASRVEESEALVKQHAVDLESLAQLNQFIVQRMQSGIMVLDNALNIRLANEAALALLGLDSNINNRPVHDISPALSSALQDWLQDRNRRIAILRPEKGEVDIQVSFARHNPDTRFGILVFMEDIGLMRQRAQHLKLASLGRLAASIAHEVRNPLGAISHAGQLLSESGQKNEEENRLVQIIIDQTHRVNTIIENVQVISRREPATPELIELKPWLEKFVSEFIQSNAMENNTLEYSVKPDDIAVRMDPTQLFQVLWNLSENALRYSTGKVRLHLVSALKQGSKRPYLDVIDSGPGIPDEVIDHLFEPFFTTESRGSGLGLYIARELCEANQASLHLYSTSEKGSCFRIYFAYAEKQQLITE